MRRGRSLLAFCLARPSAQWARRRRSITRRRCLAQVRVSVHARVPARERVGATALARGRAGAVLPTRDRTLTLLRARAARAGTGEGCFFAARVAAGHHHSAALTDRGAVYTWGRGRDYQLGHGDHASTSRARRLRGASTGPLAHIACGGYHTLLVGGGGGVWAVGNNEHGCLGTGAQPGTVHGEPERCVGLEGPRVVSAAAGWKHSAAVDESGRLFTWGWGGSSGMVDAWASSGGQLCSGRDRDRWEAGQVELPQGARVTAVACGFNHTAAIIEAASESELERVTDQLDAAAGTA